MVVIPVPTTPAGRKRRLSDAAATVVVSCLLTFIAGVVYIANALEENNSALCDILVISASPPPQPPELTGRAAPQTEAGRRLAEYNEAQARWSKDFRDKVNHAINEYRCRK